jgi:hypothetical protein
MATPSFSNFEWLNLQPAWYKLDPAPKLTDAALQAEAEMIMERASMRWHGLDRRLYRRLVKVRAECRSGERNEG